MRNKTFCSVIQADIAGCKILQNPCSFLKRWVLLPSPHRGQKDRYPVKAKNPLIFVSLLQDTKLSSSVY